MLKEKQDFLACQDFQDRKDYQVSAVKMVNQGYQDLKDQKESLGYLAAMALQVSGSMVRCPDPQVLKDRPVHQVKMVFQE